MLKGRHVVITGSTGALGEAVVEVFRSAGAVLHLPIREPAGSGPSGAQVVGGVDLTDEAAVQTFYASLPGLWASVHLAGGFRAASIAETSLADLEHLFRLNLVTTFLCCREAARAMRRGDGGRIVNVGARVSEVPASGMAAYTVSKAGVAALTRSLATELKPAGVLVNAVLPSIIDTPANRQAMPKADHDHWPKADEIARTILWLAAPENVLTSGALVPVYGRA